METHNQSKKGFTIIEVVLVLAIAGLIFLIVFLAVPALQRSQRDTQRRNDVGRFMSQVSQYQSNNQGKVPASDSELADFVNRYLIVADDSFSDPTTGVAYTYDHRTDATRPAENAYGTIYYYEGAKCNGENIDTSVTGNRTVAALTPLEGGAYFCQDNL